MYVGPRNPGRAPSTPAINTLVTAEDYLKIAELAEADGTTLSGYVRTLIRRHLDSTGGGE